MTSRTEVRTRCGSFAKAGTPGSWVCASCRALRASTTWIVSHERRTAMAMTSLLFPESRVQAFTWYVRRLNLRRVSPLIAESQENCLESLRSVIRPVEAKYGRLLNYGGGNSPEHLELSYWSCIGKIWLVHGMIKAQLDLVSQAGSPKSGLQKDLHSHHHQARSSPRR
jgi:hypothetical protein